MSKAFALAGARLGYLIADPAIVDTVRVVREASGTVSPIEPEPLVNVRVTPGPRQEPGRIPVGEAAGR